MKIGINLRMCVPGQIGGLENYVRNVIRGVAADFRQKGGSVTVFASERQASRIADLTAGCAVIAVPDAGSDAVMGAELERGYDLLFCPLLVIEPLSTRLPAAVMMPDLQHEFYPEFFDRETLRWRNQNYRASARRAEVLFTLSEHAKGSIVDKFGITPGKIQVVYLDVDEEFRAESRPAAQESFRALELPRDYVLYPANYWPHKNHTTLLRAMRNLVRSGYPELAIVLTGAPSTGAERIEKEAARLGIRRNVRMLGYVDRPVLVELYRHARALTFVSRFEGFGIPLLEAFNLGTPVISSRAGSCPEVASDAALMADETDPESIAAAIRTVFEDAALSRDLIDRGKRRAADFSWKRAVDQTLSGFERAVAAGAHSITVEERPVVSVVTPSFNMARFIEDTIGSVLGQDYPLIDYLVVDGGSTDGTQEILKRYEGRLQYISEPDGGQGDAINKGFLRSRGDIFAFLNADDTYLPGAVGTAVRHMTETPSAGVVYGEAYHVDEAGALLERYPTLPFNPELLGRRCFICQPAAFMRREAFRDAGMMNPEYHFALDYELWMRISKLYPMVKVDEYLATSRMHRDNKTLGQREKVYREILRVVKEHYEYIPYDWLLGYACYLIDRKDQFFERSGPSMLKLGLALLLGTAYNGRKAVRYWHEFAINQGLLGAKYLGRWDDGWISRHFVSEHDVPSDCSILTIRGRHTLPFQTLTMSVRLDGTMLGSVRLAAPGPFQNEFRVPSAARGRRCRLEIRTNRCYRPIYSGDYRPLSVLIDSITFETATASKAESNCAGR